jgi:hypothetical protein
MKKLAAVLFLAHLAAGQTVINGNRVITGSWDASSATSTKPAKSGTTLPSTCAAGEVYFKTDAVAGRNIFLCTSANNWTQSTSPSTAVKSITVFDPVTTDSGRVQIMFPTAVTITRVACSVKAATSVTINLDERAAATPDTAGTAVMSSALVCDTDEASSTSFSNAGIAARAPLALTISAINGTPDTLRVFVEYTAN